MEHPEDIHEIMARSRKERATENAHKAVIKTIHLNENQLVITVSTPVGNASLGLTRNDLSRLISEFD